MSGAWRLWVWSIAILHVPVSIAYTSLGEEPAQLCGYPDPPYLSSDGTGVWVDYWKLLSNQLGIKSTQWVVLPSRDAVASAVNASQCISFGWSPPDVNSDLLFTYPYGVVSIQALIPVSQLRISVLLNPFHWSLWLALVCALIVVAHALWLFERNCSDSRIPNPYWPGFRTSLQYVVRGMLGANVGTVHTQSAKFLAFGLQVTSAFVIAAYTANMVVVLLAGTPYHTPSALQGIPVGVVAGCPSCVEGATAVGGKQQTFPTIDALVTAVKKCDVDGGLADSNALRYSVQKQGVGDDVMLLGDPVAYRLDSVMLPSSFLPADVDRLNTAIRTLSAGGTLGNLIRRVAPPLMPNSGVKSLGFLDMLLVYLTLLGFLILSCAIKGKKKLSDKGPTKQTFRKSLPGVRLEERLLDDDDDDD